MKDDEKEGVSCVNDSIISASECDEFEKNKTCSAMNYSKNLSIIGDQPLSDEERVQGIIRNRRSLEEFLTQCYDSDNPNPVHSKFPYCNYRSFHWLIFSLAMGNACDASEIICVSYLLADDAFRDAVGGEDSLKWVTSAVFGGMLIGGLIGGALAHVFGRRSTLMGALTINAIGSILFSFSSHHNLMILWRFVAGLGIGASIPSIFAMATEWSPPHQRGFYVSTVASFWMVGSLYVSTIAFFLAKNWRIFSLACSFPCFMAFFTTYYFVPETASWYIDQNRQKNSDIILKVVNSVGSSMKKQVRNNTQIMRLSSKNTGTKHLTNIKPWTIQELQCAMSDLPTVETSTYSLNPEGQSLMQHSAATAGAVDAYGSKMDCWLVFCKQMHQMHGEIIALYKNKLELTLTLQSTWFVLSFTTYGLLTWINALFAKELNMESVYVNSFLFTSASLPGNIVTMLFLDKFASYQLLSVALLSSALYLVIIIVATPQLLVFGACAFQACSVSGWNVLDLFTNECYPSHERTTGMGLCAASGRIGAFVAQWVNAKYLLTHPQFVLCLSSTMLLLCSLLPRHIHRILQRPGAFIHP